MTLRLHLIDNTVFPDARANDGSPAYFWRRTGMEPRLLLVLGAGG